jgi:hypothetical protein
LGVLGTATEPTWGSTAFGAGTPKAVSFILLLLLLLLLNS